MKASKNHSQISMLRPVPELSAVLLAWYDGVHAQRDMPWRRTRDPYAIWLSETMLQQTQVETVKPYYHRFLERFPTVAALAKADLHEVVALWAGLGYYRRARFLHEAARKIVEKHGEKLPRTLESLQDLPGVGRYTAGAVASIAFGLPVPVVDGNVMRVVSRLTGYDKNIADPKNAGFFWEVAGEIVRGSDSANGSAIEGRRHGEPANGNRIVDSLSRYGDVNQSLMELGATVCVPAPARPGCLVCPVREFCRAYAEGRQMELPVKEKKKAVPEVRGRALVVFRGKGSKREVLMVKRPAGVLWEGMWEFLVLEEKQEARSKKQEGETRNGGSGLVRVVGTALGIKVVGARACGEVVHVLTHRRMMYDVVACEAVSGEFRRILPACREGGRYEEARWVAWPLVKGELAWGRVVEKIAEAAEAR